MINHVTCTSFQIIGIIDQPILKERWVGIIGRDTTMNGQLVSTRACMDLSQAYLYVLLFVTFPVISTFINRREREETENKLMLVKEVTLFSLKFGHTKSYDLYLKQLNFNCNIEDCFTPTLLFIFILFNSPWIRYTTSPHLFSGKAEEAFARVRTKVCILLISE